MCIRIRFTTYTTMYCIYIIFYIYRLVERANALAYTLVNSEIRYYEENKNDNNKNLYEFDVNMLTTDWVFSPEKG